VLKTAIRHAWLSHLPDLSPPYKTQGTIEHRPWFSLEEYRELYMASREYARNPAQPLIKWHAEQVHDYILFLANSELRPDEATARNLKHKDVRMVDDPATGERILKIDVRGKRGYGPCKSMPGAVRPHERLLARPLPSQPQGKHSRRKRGEDPGTPPLPEAKRHPGPDDPVFPGNHRKLFNGILTRAKLKYDREGKRRTACSLRHTYICMRLMEGTEGVAAGS
jgi:integrase